MRRICVCFIIVLLALHCPQDAHAQFFKKLFGKDERAPKPKPKPTPPPQRKPAPRPAPTTNNNTRTKKKQDIDLPPSVVKQRYRIDVLVPLYLDELVQNNKPTFTARMPDKAVGGVDFYEGIKMAADTLNTFGYNIDLHVHDINSASGNLNMLIRRGALDSSDLIIGAVPAAQVSMLADIAKKNNINFISAYSPSDDGVTGNPFFTQLQPSLQTHCERLMEIVDKKYPKKKLIVFQRNTTQSDQNAYKYLLQDANLDRIETLNCNIIPTYNQLAALFDSTENNVILLPIIDQAYSEKLLLQLYQYFPTYRFEVYGMPSWKGMPTLKKPEAYPNVAVYITAPFYFDNSTASGQRIVTNYKRDMGGRPGEMVFRGYETLYWYSYLLTKYGTVFNTKLNDNGFAPFTRFNIQPKWDEDNKFLYNENSHIYLFRYQSSSYMIEQQ